MRHYVQELCFQEGWEWEGGGGGGGEGVGEVGGYESREMMMRQWYETPADMAASERATQESRQEYREAVVPMECTAIKIK